MIYGRHCPHWLDLTKKRDRRGYFWERGLYETEGSTDSAARMPFSRFPNDPFLDADAMQRLLGSTRAPFGGSGGSISQEGQFPAPRKDSLALAGSIRTGGCTLVRVDTHWVRQWHWVQNFSMVSYRDGLAHSVSSWRRSTLSDNNVDTGVRLVRQRKRNYITKLVFLGVFIHVTKAALQQHEGLPMVTLPYAEGCRFPAETRRIHLVPEGKTGPSASLCNSMMVYRMMVSETGDCGLEARKLSIGFSSSNKRLVTSLLGHDRERVEGYDLPARLDKPQCSSVGTGCRIFLFSAF
jgi:hypothetical protein